MGKKVQGITLTERDKDILKLINSYGYIKKSSFVLNFSEGKVKYKNSYIPRRLKKLSDYNYIMGIGQAYALAEKGKDELRTNGININYDKSKKEIEREIERVRKMYKESTLMLNLDFKNKLSRKDTIAFEESIGHKVTTIKNFCGTVWDREDKKYLVYRLGNLSILQIIRDLKSDIKNSLIRRVIIVTDNISQMKKIRLKIQNLEVKEFLVIPETKQGLKILSLYKDGFFTDENIVKYIKLCNEKAPVKLENKKVVFAENPTVNLVILDLKKERSFRSFVYVKKPSSASIIFSEVYSDYMIENPILKLSKEDKKKMNEIKETTIRINIDKFMEVMEIE